MSDNPPTIDPAALRQRAERQLEERIARAAEQGDQTERDTLQLIHELQVHQIELELQNEELQRSRAEVEEGLARFTELYDYAPVSYLTLDRDGRIVQVNLTGTRLLHMERSRLTGWPLGLLLAPRSRPTFKAFLESAFTGRGRAACELLLLRGGATPIHMDLTGRASEDGQECRAVAVDITERKRAEAEQQRTAAEYRALAENLPDLLARFDNELRHVYVNPAAAAAGTLPAAGYIGKTIAEVGVPSPVAEQWQDRLRTVFTTGKPMQVETEFVTPDGPHTFLTTLVPEWDVDGSVRSVLSLARDISELRHEQQERERLQAHLAQSDRLASVGMLAAGVAHEINNPLAYVLYNVESLATDLVTLAAAAKRGGAALREQLGDAAFHQIVGAGAELLQPAMLDDAVDRAKEALSGTRRIKAIAKGLGTFARVEPVECSHIDVNETIQHAIHMATNEIRYRARLVQDLNPVPTVWASEGKLAQVFLNLLINAAHAIAEGHLDIHRITVRTCTEGGEVLVTVSDNGRGIAPENLARVFEPFFTTKGVGKGSGLGLAICRNLVQEMGGTIAVESELGRGTSFGIRLPISSTAPEQLAAPPAATTPAPTARGRILIVDDEPTIRRTMQRLLRRDHEVFLADSGRTACAMLEQDAAFDLILCDLMMPDMTGMEFHAWLCSHDPALAARVIFVTGGAFTPQATEYLARAGNRKIDKPFDAASVRRLVSEAVTAARLEQPPG